MYRAASGTLEDWIEDVFKTIGRLPGVEFNDLATSGQRSAFPTAEGVLSLDDGSEVGFYVDFLGINKKGQAMFTFLLGHDIEDDVGIPIPSASPETIKNVAQGWLEQAERDFRTSHVCSSCGSIE